MAGWCGISFMVLGEHLDQLILLGAASPAFLELPPSRKTGVGVSPESSDPSLFLHHLPPTKPVLLNLGFPLASPGGLFKKRLLDFPGGSVVKNLPPDMWDTWVRSLIWEDPTWREATKPMQRNY